MLKHFKTATMMLVVAMFILPATPVLAHLMLIETLEEGKVQVVYDDGTVARRAEVVVYNEQDEEISRGQVDTEGVFEYSPVEAAVIVADDGLGHRAQYVVEEDQHQAALPRGPTIALVLSGFGLIALVFHRRVRGKGS